MGFAIAFLFFHSFFAEANGHKFSIFGYESYPIHLDGEVQVFEN